MKSLPVKSQFAFLAAVLRDWRRVMETRRGCKIFWSPLGTIITDEKVYKVLFALRVHGGNWESAVEWLREKAFPADSLEKLAAWRKKILIRTGHL